MPQKSFEDELIELGYDDLIPAFQAAVRQGAQAMLGATQQAKSKEDWFGELYRQNPDLKGHEETVNFIIGRDTDLHDMPVSKSFEAVAERSRKRLAAQKNHEEFYKEHRAYSGGPDGELKQLSVDEFEQKGITRPGSLSDTIRQRRQQREQRGPTNMARYARESKAQGG